MPPGRYCDVILSSGLSYRVEHYSNDTWMLDIAGKYRYPLVPEIMPAVPRRRMIWSQEAQRYVLPFGCHPPLRWYALDSTGRRVRQLFERNGTIASRHEIRINHKSDYLSRPERSAHRLKKLFAKYPDKRAAVMKLRNSIPKLMSLRPWNLLKRKWMRLILQARYPTLRGEKLEPKPRLP
jgi:hypothetical protein